MGDIDESSAPVMPKPKKEASFRKPKKSIEEKQDKVKIIVNNASEQDKNSEVSHNDKEVSNSSH